MTHVVVVGAGQAGASLVIKLRSLGFDGAITLIGEEPQPPYQRPPLSKAYLLGEMARERLFLKPESFYADKDITLRLGEKVTDVDPKAKTVQLGAETLNYDHLVFVTGAAPRTLSEAQGGQLDGVHMVRDLRDVDGMEPEFVAGRSVLIVGGGYIGLEAAAVAAKKGINATLIVPSKRILRRVASEETANYFRALHESHGVRVLEGVGLDHLTGDGRVSGAVLSNGETLDVDFVVVGIGVTPNVDLAEAAGAKIEDGIWTDALGQTSVPGIWAAGDCASFPYRGTRIRLESVPNAIEQAEAVATNIMGADMAYEAKPWFWSDQYDVKLQIAGLNLGYDQVVTRDLGAAGTSIWYYQGETLLAVDAMNAPRDYMVAKRLIEAGKSPTAEVVSDPATDLKALLRP